MPDITSPVRDALVLRLKAALDRRDELKAKGDAIVAKAAQEQRSTLTSAETAEMGPIVEEIRTLDGGEIEEVRAAIAEEDERLRRDRIAVEARTLIPQQMGPRAVVQREERTYAPDKDRRGAENGGTSFVHDIYAYQFLGDIGARERLERHSREVITEGELNEREKRAVTSSGFAGLVVPQYLTALAALAARNGRPVANAVTRLELPDQGMSVIIPRGTTGASEASQATENTSVSSTDEVWANLTVNVNTVAGQQDVSRQSIERGIPGLDGLIYRDLAGAYAAEVDRQVIAGSGASNQALGIFSTAGVNQATAFGAAATASTFWLKLAGAVNSIEASGTVVAPANLIVMHPRRFSWLLGQVDSQGRPLVTPVQNGLQVFNGMGADMNPGAYSGNPQAASNAVDFQGFTVKGYLQGLPVVTDANVQTAVGTGPEDIVYVMNTAHALLWENGNGMPTQLRFEQTLGNQLTVKLVAYNYIAFTAGRYPTAFSIIGGNAAAGFGLVAPTF